MQNTFKRKENKYLITKEQGVALQGVLQQRMLPDLQGEHLVQSIYYDTADWDIIRQSIEKPLFKEKLRLRWYGQAEPESQGYLELKKKLQGIVYKRRFAFPLEELKGCSVREIVSANDSQIAREIGFFLRSKPVSEKIYIAYNRIAYTGTEDNDLRITFDKDILFHLSPRVHNNPCGGFQIIDQNRMLMEIKTTGAIPLWLARILSANRIFATSFSKFGACYAGCIFKWQNVKGDVKIA